MVNSDAGVTEVPGSTSLLEVAQKVRPSSGVITISAQFPVGEPLHHCQTAEHAFAAFSEEAKPAVNFSAEEAAAEKASEKAARLPRWSRRETLVLIEAKQVAEATQKKNREDRKKREHDVAGRDGTFLKSEPITESKWLLISMYCKQKGVCREANQCRKRWGNLLGDFKRIKEWQKLNGADSFWAMPSNVKKESKLPSSFDCDVFDAMEKFMGRKPGSIPETLSESGRPASEEVLFSDIEHPVQEGEAVAGLAGEPGCSNLAPDSFEEKSLPQSPGWRKRKQAGFVEPDEQKHRLLVSLDSSCKNLVSQVEAHNLMIQMDRVEKKEQSDRLLSSLGKLVDALVNLAEKF